MKKIKAIFSLFCLLTISLCVGIFAACETEPSDSQTEHTQHTFINYVSDENATCTADGTKTAVCEGCDATDTITDEGSKIPHLFQNYVENNNATCQKDATKTATCEYNCGEKDVVVLEGTRKNHEFHTYVSDNNANCKEDGTKTAYCIYYCGEKDTVTDEGSKGEHNYQNYQSNNDASCKKDGTKTSYCTGGCGNSNTIPDVGSKLSHLFQDYVSDNNATCTANGTKTATCAHGCGETDTITDVGSKIPHLFKSYTYNHDATCTRNGTKTAVCEYNCGEKDTVTATDTKLAHDFQTYVPNDDATCQKDGTKTAVCSYNCGEMDTIADVGSKVGHSFTKYQSNNDATCQADGTKTAACIYNCGETDTITDVGSKVGHSFTKYQSNNDATCTTDGSETASCDFADCTQTNTRTVAASALGHNFVLGDCTRCDETTSLTITANPTVNPFYYGASPSIKAGTVKNTNNTTVGGSWNLQTSEIQASGSSATISVEATIIFTPTSDEYAPLTTKVTTTMNAVALYNNAYYTSIDYALAQANANGSGKVYSLPLGYSTDTGGAKTAKTIQSTTEIKSGVTLVLPYSESALDESYAFISPSQSSDYKTSAYGKSAYLLNQVFIAEGVTLNNAGTIQIAGEISGGESGNYAADKNYANSVTAGKHGQLQLRANATLVNTGTINCYGFIGEDFANNGSKVHVKSGTLTAVFTFVEYRDLETFLGMIHPEDPDVVNEIKNAALSGIGSSVGKYTPDTLEMFPFNRYYIGSVTASMRVDYGASLNGFIDLNLSGEDSTATLNVINNNNAIFALKSSDSYIESKFTPTTRKTNINVYGDMKLNPLNLVVKVSKTVSSITVNMQLTLTSGAISSSDGVFLPISDLYEINLNAIDGKATVDITNQKIKLLPGSILRVGKGVTLNASSIAVYKNNSLLKNGIDSHYTVNTPAQLIVSGTLNVNSLGGTVLIGDDGASLHITNSTVVFSQEIQSLERGKTMTISVAIASVDLAYAQVNYTSDAESALYATGNTPSTNGERLSAVAYASRNGKWHTVMTVTYQANGGTIQTYTQQIVKGDVLSKDSLPIPTRDNYNFMGWYTTSDFAAGTEYEDIEITQDIVLYAKWEAVAGAVLAEFRLVGSNALDVVAMGEFKAQEITETNSKAVRPTDKENSYKNNLQYSRYVVGYFVDEACTQAFNFDTTLTESTVIYVKWDSKALITVSVEAGLSSSGIKLDDATVTETSFYAVHGQTITATAKKKSSFLSSSTVTVSESLGGTTNSGTGILGWEASASITFTVVGDTTVSMS